MQKIVKVRLRCGTTGEYYTVNRVVEIDPNPELTAKREALDAKIDGEVERESLALRRHRQIRPDKQKIAF